MIIKRVKHLSDSLQSLLPLVLIFLIYWLGIGLTSLVAKIFGKEFLDLSVERTNWRKCQKSGGLDRMY